MSVLGRKWLAVRFFYQYFKLNGWKKLLFFFFFSNERKFFLLIILILKKLFRISFFMLMRKCIFFVKRWAFRFFLQKNLRFCFIKCSYLKLKMNFFFYSTRCCEKLFGKLQAFVDAKFNIQLKKKSDIWPQMYFLFLSYILSSCSTFEEIWQFSLFHYTTHLCPTITFLFLLYFFHVYWICNPPPPKKRSYEYTNIRNFVFFFFFVFVFFSLVYQKIRQSHIANIFLLVLILHLFIY